MERGGVLGNGIEAMGVSLWGDGLCVQPAALSPVLHRAVSVLSGVCLLRLLLDRLFARTSF